MGRSKSPLTGIRRSAGRKSIPVRPPPGGIRSAVSRPFDGQFDLSGIAGDLAGKATRCFKPWVVAERLGSGRLLPCCSRFIKTETLEKCALSSEKSLTESWNAEGIRRMRRAWAKGRPGETCAEDCPLFHGGLSEGRWIFQTPKSRPVYENTIKALREFAAGAEVLESLPQNLTISVSSRCNSRCIMCTSQAGSDWVGGLTEVIMGQAESEEIESFFPVLRVLSLTGGEPLLEPQARKLLSRFDAARFPDGTAHIITNGLKLTPALVRELRRTRLALTVSVNAASRETYEKITGLPEGYEKVLRNLRALVDASSGFTAAPMLTLSFVIMKANYRELPGFLRLASSLNAGIRLLPIFGDQAGQSIFTSERLLLKVTEFLERRVAPSMSIHPPQYRQMVDHMVRVQRARLERRDFSPY